jgi:hypothetical protein
VKGSSQEASPFARSPRLGLHLRLRAQDFPWIDERAFLRQDRADSDRPGNPVQPLRGVLPRTGAKQAATVG